MQEIMASWRDFMDYTPERDDQFEEGDRKSRGKFTWKTRLRQLNTIMQYHVTNIWAIWTRNRNDKDFATNLVQDASNV